MIRFKGYSTVIVMLLFSLLFAQAIGVNADTLSGAAFSADTYQKGPQGSEKFGKIFVQNNLVRTEIIGKNDREIRIFDADKSVSYLLDPDKRQYREIPYTSMPLQKSLQDGEVNPCDELANLHCERLGVTNISGRDAVEWDIFVTQGENNLRIRQWVDAERGNILRYITDTGEYSELKLLGTDRLGDRTVEKWEMVFSDGAQSNRRSLSWFDPVLNLTVKEEYPEGYVREIRNIRVQVQKPELFLIPVGYQKIDSPDPSIDQ